MKRIAVIGANPAWQKVLSFAELVKGAVNRASEKLEFPSGKGINCARAIRMWGENAATVIQFAGGVNGRFLTAGLDAEGLRHVSIEVDFNTRGCTTCLCRQSGTMTELIEPAGRPSDQAVAAFEAAAEMELAHASGLAVCGTLPGGLPADIYARIAAGARRRGLPVLLDAWENIGCILNTGAAVILKINAEELRRLTGEPDIASGIAGLYREYPNLAGVGITDGPGRAYWGDPGVRIHACAIPRLDRVVNPLGCGDTVSGVTLYEILAGRPGVEAFAAGLAAAQANCLSEKCAEFDSAAAREFLNRITIEEL